MAIINSVISGGGSSPNIQSLSVTPTTSSQTITASGGVDGYSPVNVSAVDSSIDANIQAGNIKSGVSILGVTGSYSGGGSKYGCTIDNLLGNVNGILQMPSNTSGDIVFTGVKDFVNYCLYYRCYNNQNLTHGVEFPDLETVSGTYAAVSCFALTKITSCSLPKLKTITGNNALQSLVATSYVTTISLPELETVSGNQGISNFCSGCSFLTSISLPKLKTVTGSYGIYSLVASTAITSLSLPELTTANGSNCLGNICNNCVLLETASFTKLSDISGATVFVNAFLSAKKLKDVYFNGLTTTSFGSYINQFNGMFNATTGSTATGGCTVHFPSNLQSTISGLTGYPTFGGSASYITLAFDLTATS